MLRVSEDLSELVVSPVAEGGGTRLGAVRRCSTEDTPGTVLSAALGETLSAPSRLLAAGQTHAAVLVGFPELEASEHELYRWPREEAERPASAWTGREAPPPADHRHTTVVQPATGQVSGDGTGQDSGDRTGQDSGDGTGQWRSGTGQDSGDRTGQWRSGTGQDSGGSGQDRSVGTGQDSGGSGTGQDSGSSGQDRSVGTGQDSGSSGQDRSVGTGQDSGGRGQDRTAYYLFLEAVIR